MQTNTIRARLAFSYKAENYAFDTILDLDHCPVADGEEPDFQLLLAKAAGIDPYSYMYEVLATYDVEFYDPTGIATLSCRNGRFDWPQFERHRREELGVQIVRAIAEQSLGVHDLDQHADLKTALLAAYRAGQGEKAAQRE